MTKRSQVHGLLTARLSLRHRPLDNLGECTPRKISRNFSQIELSSSEHRQVSESFKQYIITNNVKEEKRVAGKFWTTTSSRAHSVLWDLLILAKPSEMKLTELMQTLQNHCEPKPIVLARFPFHRCEQHEGGKLAAYNAAFKKMFRTLCTRFILGGCYCSSFAEKQADTNRLTAEKSLTWTTPI